MAGVLVYAFAPVAAVVLLCRLFFCQTLPDDELLLRSFRVNRETLEQLEELARTEAQEMRPSMVEAERKGQGMPALCRRAGVIRLEDVGPEIRFYVARAVGLRHELYKGYASSPTPLEPLVDDLDDALLEGSTAFRRIEEPWYLFYERRH